MKRVEGVPARSESGREPSPAYNLFRREDKPDLYCAVPDDCPVPVFLGEKHWAFAGQVSRAAAFPGFQEEQARSGVRLNGFYLFMGHHTVFAVGARSSAPELRAA